GGGVEIWDVASGKRLRMLSIKGQSFYYVAVSRDGRLVAAAGTQVRVWNSDSGERVLSLRKSARGIAFSPDGLTLAMSRSGGVVLVDVRTGEPVGGVFPAGGFAESVTFSPRGDQIAIGAAGASIYSVATRKLLVRLAGESPVHSLVFSSRGGKLFT